MAERNRAGNKKFNDNKEGSRAGRNSSYSEKRSPKTEGSRTSSYSEKRSPKTEGSRTGSYSEKRSPKTERSRTGSYSEKRNPKTEGSRTNSYSEKRGPKTEGSRTNSYSEKRNPKTEGSRTSSYSEKRSPKTEGNRTSSYNGKRSPKFDSERKSIYSEPIVDLKPDFELQDELLGESDKLEGRNSIMEALKANRTINKIFVAKGEREGSIRQIIAMAREKKIVITEVEHGVIDSMSTTKSHQGIIAFVAVKEYVEVDDILEIARQKGQPPFIIILDEISDPNNFGAILRTADAVGAHGVIIPKRRAIGLTSAVSKASAGAVEYVPVARVTNIAQTIEYLKKENVWVVGTDAAGEKAFYENDLRGPIALVVGSEGQGMGKLIREKCDFIVNIPMQGNISSLNASVAAAIVMYEILKQRDKA